MENVRFRLLLVSGWLLVAYVMFAFFGALGATDGHSLSADFVRRLHTDFPRWLVLVAPALAWVAWRDRRTRRQRGLPVGKLLSPVDASDAVVVRAPVDHVFEAVLGVVRALPRVRVVSADLSNGRITARAGISWQSWGERIRIQFSPVSAEETSIAINSGPTFGPTLFDYGSNQSNVAQILAGLRLSLPSSF